jgi:hypothetical protein
MTSTIRKEFAGAINGVGGRFFNVVAAEDGRILNQKWSASRYPTKDYRVQVDVRFDDECRNGHETFSITGQTWRDGREDCCGCIHDIIAEVFPELAHLIKWHLVSTDGPMHYVANTCYFASNRDYDGLLKGEENKRECHVKHFVKFGDSPIEHQVGKKLKTFIDETLATDGEFIIDKVEHKAPTKSGEYEYAPKYQFAGMDCAWYECPFDNLREANAWLEAITTTKMTWSSRTNMFGKGKERELDAARSAAIWPEATDDELSVERPELEKKLLERLPIIMEAFKADVVGAGFLWPTN